MPWPIPPSSLPAHRAEAAELRAVVQGLNLVAIAIQRGV